MGNLCYNPINHQLNKSKSFSWVSKRRLCSFSLTAVIASGNDFTACHASARVARHLWRTSEFWCFIDQVPCTWIMLQVLSLIQYIWCFQKGVLKNISQIWMAFFQVKTNINSLKPPCSKSAFFHGKKNLCSWHQALPLRVEKGKKIRHISNIRKRKNLTHFWARQESYFSWSDTLPETNTASENKVSQEKCFRVSGRAHSLKTNSKFTLASHGDKGRGLAYALWVFYRLPPGFIKHFISWSCGEDVGRLFLLMEGVETLIWNKKHTQLFPKTQNRQTAKQLQKSWNKNSEIFVKDRYPLVN